MMWHVSVSLGPGAQFWGMPSTKPESVEFLERECNYLMLTCCNLYLAVVCPLLLQQTSLSTWAVFLNTYLIRALFYRGNDERMFHGFDLMTLALVAYYCGMRHRR